ncbi:MAG: histidine phosphatase family protein [Chromatiaceae bacterium]|nr:histidine phosphatase family protein [Chromatiaceae bacterium]
MRAIVVRHYKTLINASGQIMGWGDAPPVKEWEADLHYVESILRQQDLRISAIYTSYLDRARRTGMFYARKWGIPMVHDMAALNEINYGTLFRKSKLWVEQNFPAHKKDPDLVYPEGESFRQMQMRSIRFMDSLCARYRDKTLLVVVHAGVIRGFVSHYLELNYADNLKREISHRYIGDFYLEAGRCARYDELGEPSGFINEGVLSVPLQREDCQQAM